MQKNPTLGGIRHNIKNEEETHNEVSKIFNICFMMWLNIIKANVLQVTL